MIEIHPTANQKKRNYPVTRCTSLQLEIAQKCLDDLQAKYQVCNQSGIRMNALINAIKNKLLSDPSKLPENKLVTIQISVRKKNKFKAYTEFKQIANLKYK